MSDSLPQKTRIIDAWMRDPTKTVMQIAKETGCERQYVWLAIDRVGGKKVSSRSNVHRRGVHV